MINIKRFTAILAFIALAFGISFLLLDKKELDQPKLLPGEWMGQQRMYPYSEIKTDVYLAEMKKAHQMNQQSRSLDYEWEFVGPTNIGGRITDIEMPLGQSDVIYIGAATGGILKTEDAGDNWDQLFEGIPTISIGDIVIDPNNSDIIYAGTGEANSSSFSFLGSGIYKSEDAGETWNFSGLENSAYIARMIVDHSNSQRVFAAASGNLFSPSDDRGIYRSEDGRCQLGTSSFCYRYYCSYRFSSEPRESRNPLCWFLGKNQRLYYPSFHLV